MEEKNAYIKKFNARIQELQADLDKLDAKAHKSEADMRIKYENEINQLKQKQTEAQAKLEEIKNASEDAWTEFKAGADKAYEDLKSSWKAAWDKFK
jgi:chromosome segregation ATPase